MAISHIAFNFGPWRQRRDGVNDDDIDRRRANQHVADFQRLLTGIRLRNQHIVCIDTQSLSVHRV